MGAEPPTTALSDSREDPVAEPMASAGVCQQRPNRHARDAFVVDSRSRLQAFAQALLNRYRIPSSRLQADDVANHTIAEVLARWDSIDEPQRYMFSVARHLVWRAAREGQRFTGAPRATEFADLDQIDPAAFGLVQPPMQVDDQAWVRIRAEQLYAAMDRLTPQQQRAVALVDLHGVPRADAAAAMEVTEGAVSAHRDRGRKKLRVLLQDLACFLISGAVMAGIALAHRRSTHERPSLGPLEIHLWAPVSPGWVELLAAVLVIVGVCIGSWKSTVLVRAAVLRVLSRIRSRRTTDAPRPAGRRWLGRLRRVGSIARQALLVRVGRRSGETERAAQATATRAEVIYTGTGPARIAETVPPFRQADDAPRPAGRRWAGRLRRASSASRQALLVRAGRRPGETERVMARAEVIYTGTDAKVSHTGAGPKPGRRKG